MGIVVTWRFCGRAGFSLLQWLVCVFWREDDFVAMAAYLLVWERSDDDITMALS